MACSGIQGASLDGGEWVLGQEAVGSGVGEAGGGEGADAAGPVQGREARSEAKAQQGSTCHGLPRTSVNGVSEQRWIGHTHFLCL